MCNHSCLSVSAVMELRSRSAVLCLGLQYNCWEQPNMLCLSASCLSCTQFH